MNSLPFPEKQEDIAKLLGHIDGKLLNCSANFIKLQIKKPTEKLASRKIGYYDSSNPQYDWFNIYSIYCANQQLNESCNKLWAAVELYNLTSSSVWKKSYIPIGEEFSGTFSLGTLIPTLHYAQLSAMVSMLSLFGCIPIIVNRQPCFLIRTEKGWMLFNRSDYLKKVLSISAKGWHEQILRTYAKLSENGVGLPVLNIKKIHKLKDLRNSMHYEVLGDLKMWRMLRSQRIFPTFLTLVVSSIDLAMESLNSTKKITSGCDARFFNLKQNLSKLELR